MEGLTNEQEQEYQRDKKVAAYLANNQTTVDTYVPLQTKQTAFVANIQALEILVTGKIITTTGLTTGKAAKKKAVGVFYEGVCGSCRAFLIETGNTTLADNFMVTKSRIIHLLDGDVLPLVTLLNTWITDVLIPDAGFAAYGVDAATVTAGTNLANAFVAEIGQASAIDSGKEASAIDVELKVNDLRNDITILDLLVRTFITSNVNFYNGFQSAKVIDDIGVHHTGIRGEIEKGGAPIPNASVSCPALNKSVKSNVLGHYEIPTMKPGTYLFICAAPSIKDTISRIIKVKKGRTLEVDWDFGGPLTPDSTSEVLEGNVAAAAIANIDIEDIQVTASTTITFELPEGFRFYVAASPTDPPGTTFWDAPAGTQTMTIDEFKALLGFDDFPGTPFLNVQNNALVTLHYKITITNLEG